MLPARLPKSKAQLRFEKLLRTSRYNVISTEVEESQILKQAVSLVQATSPHFQLLFQIAQVRLSASASRSDIEDCPSRPDCSCSEKIQCWSEFPQICSEDCAAAHYQIASQIVRPNHLPAALWFRVADD